MELDWVTVSAQVVNFLALIWLLKRFLYAPIVNAMDRREQRIAERLDEAAAREGEAQQAAREHREALESLDGRRDELLAEAREAAEDERKRLLDKARAEIDEVRAAWRHEVEGEKREFLGALRRETADAVEAIARRALRELAGVELESSIVRELVGRLDGLDARQREALAAGGAVRVASAYELDPGARSRITRAVHKSLSEDIAVDYEQDPELVCGIELTSEGRRVGFSVADFLDDLDARFDEALSPAAAKGG